MKTSYDILWLHVMLFIHLWFHVLVCYNSEM